MRYLSPDPQAVEFLSWYQETLTPANSPHGLPIIPLDILYNILYIKKVRVKDLKYVSGSEYFSTEEAAEELGIKESAVRNYLSAGKFTTYKFKTLTLLDVNEIKEWKLTRGKRWGAGYGVERRGWISYDR